MPFTSILPLDPHCISVHSFIRWRLTNNRRPEYNGKHNLKPLLGKQRRSFISIKKAFIT